ncbi:MAG: YraN family protein, partial [candidate division WOR-3 bacterium]
MSRTCPTGQTSGKSDLSDRSDIRELGRVGEDWARHYLEKKGYRLLDSNVRSRLGEIDLVCQDRTTIVFVEVKTRRSNRFGLPAEAVGPKKQMRLRRLAEEYLIANRREGQDVRFDVV